MNQSGGKALVMEAEATSQLQKLGVLPTDDKPKYIWHKVIISCLAIDCIVDAFRAPFCVTIE